MSRSHRASTEPSTLATALGGAGGRARLVHRGRLEHSGLGAPRPSKRGLLRIAIAIVPLATAHGALASSVRHAHSTQTAPRRSVAPPRPIAVVRRRRTAVAGARARLLGEMRRDGDIVLSRGSGYGTAAGSPLVRALQIQLSRRGYRPGAIDGLYGPRTQASVWAFQGNYGLAIDGVAGPRTLREMTARTPVLYPGAGEARRRGAGPACSAASREPDIRPVQSTASLDRRPSKPCAVTRPLTDFRRAASRPRTMARLHPRPIARPRVDAPGGRSRRGPEHAPASDSRAAADQPSVDRGRPHGRPSKGTSTGWELPAGIAAAALLLLTGAWYLRRRRGAPPQAPPTEPGYAGAAQATAATTPLPEPESLPAEAESLPAEAESLPAEAESLPAEAESLAPEAESLPHAAGPEFPEANGGPPVRVEDEFERAGARAEAVIAFNMAVSLERQDDRAGARADMSELNGQGTPVRPSISGIILELDGDVEGARAAYARADQRGDANGAFNLGMPARRAGRRAGALDCLRTRRSAGTRRGRDKPRGPDGGQREHRQGPRRIRASRAAWRSERRRQSRGAA